MDVKRRHHRTQVEIPVSYQTSASDVAHEGVVTDISFGGSFVESGEVPAFGAKVPIRTRLPGQTSDRTLPGVVRWFKPTGFGVQFGLLGVRETHALTQFLRMRAQQSSSGDREAIGSLASARAVELPRRRGAPRSPQRGLPPRRRASFFRAQPMRLGSAAAYAERGVQVPPLNQKGGCASATGNVVHESYDDFLRVVDDWLLERRIKAGQVGTKTRTPAVTAGIAGENSTPTGGAIARPLYTGRLNLAIVGEEPGFYHLSTYYGDKDILAIAVGGQYQGQTPAAEDNYREINADLSLREDLLPSYCTG